MSLAAIGGLMGGRLVRKWGLTLLTVLIVLSLASLALRQFLELVGRTPHPVTEISIAGRQVAMWKPAGPAPPDGYPVILFSHGFTGCGTQSVFLTDGLAQAGYFVLAPNHHDAGCGPGVTKGASLKDFPPCGLRSLSTILRLGARRPTAIAAQTWKLCWIRFSRKSHSKVCPLIPAVSVLPGIR